MWKKCAYYSCICFCKISQKSNICIPFALVFNLCTGTLHVSVHGTCKFTWILSGRVYIVCFTIPYSFLKWSEENGSVKICLPEVVLTFDNKVLLRMLFCEQHLPFICNVCILLYCRIVFFICRLLPFLHFDIWFNF